MSRRRSGMNRGTTSFSRRVRDELSQTPLPRDVSLVRAELSGVLEVSPGVRLAAADGEARVSTGHPGAARRIFNLFRVATDLKARLSAGRSNRFDRRLTFGVTLPRGISPGDIDPPESGNSHHPERVRAYLRGAFLIGGSINDPRSGYHLEIRCASEETARGVEESLRAAGIIGSSARGGTTYVKDAESIADFLRVVGASRSLLRFEDIRVMREVKNRVNRRINFETANMNKSIDAALRQIQDSEELSPEVFDKLSARTREIMRLRIDNPEASLRELGEMADPPVTKSTVEYHFRKIRQLVGRGDPT